jgi:hypothetical protein
MHALEEGPAMQLQCMCARLLPPSLSHLGTPLGHALISLSPAPPFWSTPLALLQYPSCLIVFGDEERDKCMRERKYFTRFLDQASLQRLHPLSPSKGDELLHLSHPVQLV